MKVLVVFKFIFCCCKLKTTILYLQNEKPEVVIDLPTNGRPTGKNALPFDWEHRVSS